MKKIILITFVFLLSLNVAYGALNDSLHAYYSFDTDTNPINDSSENNNNATKNGATHNTTTYKVGSGSYYFDGTDDYFVTQFTIQGKTEGSWAAWIKTTDTASHFLGSSNTGGNDFKAGNIWISENRMSMRYSGTHNWVSSSTDIDDDAWHYHVGVWIKNANITLYLDGDTVINSTSLDNTNPNFLTLGIGAVRKASGYEDRDLYMRCR